MIELKKINKVYEDGFQALKNIDLTFEEGKINVLIGPSGCGKTTTMKLLNKLTNFTDGQILIDGKNIMEINPIELRRQMGYVIQNIGLFPHMTIFDNVATVPKLLKWNKEKIKQRVDELLDMVDLDPEVYRGRYPSELSGGQQQRIGVIRALAAEPATILMDEPFSALDPISRGQLQDELVRLQEKINKTIIFVTHDMDEAIKIADQIILLKDGQVIQKGSPDEILNNPANDFVKEFVGVERLENAKGLPSLSNFIQKDYLSISEESSVKEAINLMIKNSLSEIPVINNEGKYLGVISLYASLNNQDSSLEKLKDTSKKTILEITNIDKVAKEMDNINESIIPIVSKDNKLIGLLDNNKLFKSLHEIYEKKSGGS